MAWRVLVVVGTVQVDQRYRLTNVVRQGTTRPLKSWEFKKNVQHWILIIMERIEKRKTLILKDKGSLEKLATEPPASG